MADRPSPLRTLHPTEGGRRFDRIGTPGAGRSDVLRFGRDLSEWEGGAVVIDYRDARLAVAAQRVLDGAGIAAVYTPQKLVAVSDDPIATLWLVHRVTVPAADDGRAAAVLDEYGLLDRPEEGRPTD